MANISGSMAADIEMNHSAEKVWVVIMDAYLIFPKVYPDQYLSIKILEGTGKSPGSIRLITYGEGSPLVKISEEKIDTVDNETRTVTYSIIGGDLLKYYKTFNGKIVVEPKGEAGSLVKWSCTYEKAHEEVPDPTIIKDFAVRNISELDEYIGKN
ncbi:hypothetical protein ACFE04_023786 [Oxalis oulophora]